MGQLENGRVPVLVDRHDTFGGIHPGAKLNGARNPAGNDELRLDGAARQPDLLGIMGPTHLHQRSGRRQLSAKQGRQFF